jgi:hypothetical protein
MAPTLYDISQSSTPELRRAHKRPTRHPVLDLRTRVSIPHARITFAESPELYLREEMG